MTSDPIAITATTKATVNLTPVLDVLAYAVLIGVGLFVLFWVGFFILAVVGSAFDFLSGNRDNEFGAIVVFWGAVAIVVALIVLAFTQDIVAFE